MPETNTIEAINQAIKRADARWVAGETSVSSYAGRPAGGAERFGLAFDPAKGAQDARKARLHESAMFHIMAPPPPKIDWRSHMKKNWVTPVRDQGPCGACVAFATVAVLEARLQIAARKVLPQLDLSEAHLFFCGAGQACGSGWNFEPALKHCQSKGVGLEKDFPYTPGNQPCKPNVKAVAKAPSFTLAASAVARKQALLKGPVVGGLQVFSDFMTYQKGVYSHVAGVFEGWHAVAVVGYDDTEACWIVKNSWGMGWGENGFFRIAYGQCAIDSTVAFYDPTVRLVGKAPSPWMTNQTTKSRPRPAAHL